MHEEKLVVFAVAIDNVGCDELQTTRVKVGIYIQAQGNTLFEIEEIYSKLKKSIVSELNIIFHNLNI